MLVTKPAPAQADASAAGWVRALIPLGLASTLTGLTSAFITPFMTLYLTQVIRSSPVRTSLFLIVSAVAAVAVGNAAGRISDRPGGRRLTFVVATISGATGFATYALVGNYWTLLVVALTLIAAAGAVLPQIFALGREILDRDHPARAAMGVNALRMMLSLAWAAGAPVGALLLGVIGYTGLFLATAAAHLVILGLVLALKDPRASSRPRERARRPGAAARSGTRESVGAAPAMTDSRRGMLIGSAAAFVLLQCVTSLTVTTMPLFVSVDLRGSVRDAGLVLGLCAALEIPLMLVFGAFASRWPMRRLLLLGCAFGTAYCLAVSLADRVWQVAAAQVLHACFVCAIGGLGITYFQQLLPSALGRATTLFTNAGRVSGILAGLLFGFVEVHGYRLAYLASLGLSLLGAAVLALTHRLATAPPAEPVGSLESVPVLEPVPA